VAEAMSSFLVPSGVLLLLVFLGGGHTLYEWSHSAPGAHHGALAAKQAYLNVPFFVVRLIGFILLWAVLSRKVVRSSRGGQAPSVKWSIIFLIVFAFTYSFASFDWLMSIEPHWYSTVYALYTFSGFFVAGFAVLTIAVVKLDEFGYLPGLINENHYHDLGKFLFGFSTFWAYLWFSQYMLIWYANIPEETGYYLLRTHNDWDWLFYFNLLINWVIPFFVLLPRSMKRSRDVLLRVGILLLIGRWLDLYLLVAPNVYHGAGITTPTISWIEVGVAVGTGGLFVLVCAAALAKHRLVAKDDPFFEEGVHLTQ